MITLNVKSRDYQDYTWVSDTPVELPAIMQVFNPLDMKLFHNDTLDFTGKVVASPYRQKEHICGVLIVEGKTYGRLKDKLLYKCIPDADHLPIFYVPYEEKTNTFSKLKKNKYITFQIKEWRTKQPFGIITNTLGNVDDIEAYTGYQLLCNELNSSVKHLNSVTIRALREKLMSNLPMVYGDKVIEDRRTRPIISIDPKGCLDIDDAIGLYKTSNGQTVLSIYISNVPLMIDYLNLWSDLSDRISTIYLKDKRIQMLPSSLSDNRFSLKEGEERLAFVIDIHTAAAKSIDNVTFHTCLIRVEKNYVYEEQELLARSDYQEALKLVKYFNQYTKLNYVNRVNDSHDLIEFCMIMMNYECSKVLLQHKRGIFRCATKKETTGTKAADEKDEKDEKDEGEGEGEEDRVRDAALEKHTSDESLSVLNHILQNVAGEYCSVETVRPHELIAGGLETYVHITSPIRRLVDCINMLELQRGTFINSIEASKFLEKWLTKIPYINQQTKAIRRLQNEVELLHMYAKNKDQTYSGLVFARKTAEAPLFNYRVYIHSIKLLTSVYSVKKVNNNTLMEFTIHWFLDETKMNKKIRLQML